MAPPNHNPTSSIGDFVPRQRRAAAATSTETAAIGAGDKPASRSICAAKIRKATREDPAARHGPEIRRWLRRAMRRLDDVNMMLKGIAGAAGLPRKKRTKRGCRAGAKEKRRADTATNEKTRGIELV